MFIKHILMNGGCVIPDIEASLGKEVYYVGETVAINIALPEDSTGTVSTIVNSQEYTGTVYNGSSTINIPNLSADEYNLIITYSGDNVRYKSTDIKIHFSVLKRTPTVSVTYKDITEGKDEVITVNVNSDATGRCSAIIENKTSGVIYETEYYDDVTNGTAKIRITDLSAGKYIAHVRYSGNDKYLPLSADPVQFTVSAR